jgi:hypothetical protein
MKNATVWMMALCMLAATACANRMNQGGSSPSGGSPGGSTGSMMTGADNRQAQAQTGAGVVQAIDQLQRQELGAGAMGAAGAAAAGGSMGGAPTDKVYRVTLRLDDGSSQMLVEEAMPSYKVGDRVRYHNGMVQSY